MYSAVYIVMASPPPPPQALVEAQQQFRGYIPDFTFNLGFCGHYYCKGTGGSVGGSTVRGGGFCWRQGSEFAGVRSLILCE